MVHPIKKLFSLSTFGIIVILLASHYESTIDSEDSDTSDFSSLLGLSAKILRFSQQAKAKEQDASSKNSFKCIMSLAFYVLAIAKGEKWALKSRIFLFIYR